MEGLLNSEAVATATRLARRPAKSRTRKPMAAPKPDHPSSVRPWASFGVILMLVLSAALNGFANSLHAPLAWAGWLMGLAVLVIVLVLAKVAGEKYCDGQRPVAWFAGGSGIALLFLSVLHCSHSIAALTGSPVALALPMSVGIDCGLIACEVALISEGCRERSRSASKRADQLPGG